MREDKGFALLDVITGILILGIGISCLADLSSTTRYFTYLSQWKAKAANQAQSRLEDLRSLNWDEIHAQFPLGESVETDTLEGIGITTLVTESSVDVLEIEVSARWTLQGKKGTVTLNSLLSRR